jgi:ATP-dependent exoDNAse (exonuclease V) alpha subunit
LAKWLRDQTRANPTAVSPPTEPRPVTWVPATGSVLIVDEASMASTFDLDRVVALAYATGTKVVLVGDPAQIGVINGPGGLLAALAARGHGIELSTVHRFTNDWEADASLRLRRGDASVVTTYAEQGRVHPVRNPDLAAVEVFTHWQTAKAAGGGDAMMMARTRADVDQLNHLAKTAAQAAGDSHGPELIVGERSFQAGDLIRTKRNTRMVPLGEGHVRNGDRYTVLATTEHGGLLVDDLAGRGRTLLPPRYVEDHVEHGWAATIDAAQGATTDIAIALVRPGIDREHLYVGLTRGREENHAYIAPAADNDPDHPHRHGHPMPSTDDTALDTLRAALAHTGVTDAAHTLLTRQLALGPAPTPEVDPPHRPGAWEPQTPGHGGHRDRSATAAPQKSRGVSR